MRASNPGYTQSARRLEWHKLRIENEVKLVAKIARKKLVDVMRMDSEQFDYFLEKGGYVQPIPPWERRPKSP